MVAQNAPVDIKERSLLLRQQANILAQGLRRLGLASLMVTILLLADWRAVYMPLALPLRLLDPVVLPPELLAPNGKYVPLYPSDFGALATLFFWLLARVVGGLGRIGSAPRPAGIPGMQAPTPAAWKSALQVSAFGLKIVAPLGGLAGLAALSATQAIAPVLALKIALHLVILLGFVLALRNLRPPVWGMIAPLALLLAAQGVLALLEVWAQSTLVGQVLYHWDYEATAGQRGASVIQLADGSRWLRAYGTFPHPNILGGFLCLALPVVTGAALRQRWRSPAAWLLWLAVASGLAALVLSFSRGAWLGALGALVWAWLVRRQALYPGIRRVKSPLRAFGHLQARGAGKTRLCRLSAFFWATWVLGLLLLAVVGGLVVVLGPMLQSRLLLKSNPLEQQSVDERVILLEASAVFISQHPLLGVGAGNMPLVELSYPPTSDIAQPAHNVPIAVGVETGLGGLLLWLIPPLSILWGVWRERSAEGSEKRLQGQEGQGVRAGGLDGRRPLAATVAARQWALVGSSALVAVLIAAQFDHYFWSQPIGRLMYWVAIGLCVCPAKPWGGLDSGQ